MKKVYLVSLFLLYAHSLYAIGLGMTGAVKNRVQELDAKIVEQRNGNPGGGDPGGPATPLQISDVQYTVGYTSAAVTCRTNTVRQVNLTIEYGTSTAYGKSAFLVGTSMGLLVSGKTYHFRITAIDGNRTATTPDMTLTTLTGSTVTFTHPIIDLADFDTVSPMGWMNPAPNGHTFPTPSTGFELKSPLYANPVYAPADGVITGIEYLPTGHETAVRITFSPTFFLTIGHLSTLDAAVTAAAGTLTEQENYWNPVAIPVHAGDIIGRMGDQRSSEISLDNYMQENAFIDIERAGFATYRDGVLKYFQEPLRTQLYALVTGSPTVTDGQFVYDQPGKLSGNWYLNINDPSRQPLGFVYDNKNPSTILITQAGGLGPAVASGGLYAVAGNAPDPATVTMASGKIAYELHNFGFGGNALVGVLIAQLTGPQTLKVEFFPGSSNLNESFTSNAITCSR